MLSLVTGATGKVGHALALALVERGDRVSALVRDPARARRLLPPAVELVAGDLTDGQAAARAVSGCELVFNAIGLPEQWLGQFFLWNAAPDSAKARRELGWEPTSLEHGLRETLSAMDLPLV